MFVLDWTAYPFITLAVALPMAVLWLIEHRKEVQADREYDGPCMAHTGTDRDGTELWCWQRYGHEGPHDDSGAYEEMMTILRRDWKPWFGPDGEVTGYVTPKASLGAPTLCTYGENGAGNESACWKPDGHRGPHMVQGTDTTFDERD